MTIIICIKRLEINDIGAKSAIEAAHVAEHDLSGVVVDSNGTEFPNGDNVYGWIPGS